MRKAPELLAPAGSLDMMRTAFDFGADAIYAGQPRYSLRVRNNEFGTLEKLGEGIAEAHARGKQFFVVSNIFPHNAKLATYLDDMAPVVALKPDALIMSDPGLIDMVRETWPEQAVHLSVQSNTVNWAAVRFWKKLGLTRIILSRELSLDEVAEIRQQCPDIELEVFVHGALCIAYSGRCLLSGYFNHRDPNQGTCTNSCRWDYKVHTPAGQPVQLGDMFRGFQDDFGGTFLIGLMTSLFTFLWSLLLIIPGIVYSYGIYFANELMVDNSNLSPMEALKLSRRMVDGHRGELFRLDLSFILWWLLMACTALRVSLLAFLLFLFRLGSAENSNHVIKRVTPRFGFDG